MKKEDIIDWALMALLIGMIIFIIYYCYVLV